MEQIIKSIIQIDRNAIKRQEEAQEELDLLGRQKKDLLLKLKSEMEARKKLKRIEKKRKRKFWRKKRLFEKKAKSVLRDWMHDIKNMPIRLVKRLFA